MRKEKKETRKDYTYIRTALSLLTGITCGILLGPYIKFFYEQGVNAEVLLLLLAVLTLILYAVFFLQILIHETGHLLFGALTGYRYSSFRIGSFMWIKENGKLRFRRLSLAGTGGQCLMAPPDMVDGKLPVFLYNMGGSILNLVFVLIFLSFSMLCGNAQLLSRLFQVAAVTGLYDALVNGIPMRFKLLDNDGYNALSLRKSKGAVRFFWIEMKITELTAAGVRLKDMPEEWFVVPTPSELQTNMGVTIGVFVCNRLMDCHLFKEADRLMAQLLQDQTAITGLHRDLLLYDRIYCELVGENRQAKLEELQNQRQKKLLKFLKKCPSVLRTKYTYSLLAAQDLATADQIKRQFEACARTYPYSIDIQSERELIKIAEDKLSSAVCAPAVSPC